MQNYVFFHSVGAYTVTAFLSPHTAVIRATEGPTACLWPRSRLCWGRTSTRTCSRRHGPRFTEQSGEPWAENLSSLAWPWSSKGCEHPEHPSRTSRAWMWTLFYRFVSHNCICLQDGLRMIVSRDLDCTNTLYIQFSFKFITKGCSRSRFSSVFD